MTKTLPTLEACLTEMPLIAILRGITPTEAKDVVDLLFEEGFRIVEVPMNSPEAFESIRIMTEAHGDMMLTGAGTVQTTEQIDKVAAAGGRLIVSPHFDPEVVSYTKAKGLYSAPGVMTPSEGFAALKLGADCLKFFPAEMAAPKVIKAMRAVLPKDCTVVPVGGINETNMADYWAVGSNGFGIGGNLYTPGKALNDIRAVAKCMVETAQSLKKS